MKTQINFLARAFCTALLLLLFMLNQCKPRAAGGDSAMGTKELQISLAEWSIHEALDSGVLLAENFPLIAKNDFDISAVEYVSTYYANHALDEAYWQRLRATSDSLGVKSLLIMVDKEGDLGNTDPAQRKIAVENHFKWVNAASILGCHSIRVNAFGYGPKDQVMAAMVDAMKQLCTYASERNISVLIENHGLYSSDGQWVAEIMRRVNMPNCGTLPDFGNWCTTSQWGTTQDGRCNYAGAESYDRYKGVAEMLPFARGVSAKSYRFNEQGDETIIDYTRMLKIVRDSGFDGYIGIEFEGSQLTEKEGILATKALLEKSWDRLSTK